MPIQVISLTGILYNLKEYETGIVQNNGNNLCYTIRFNCIPLFT